MTTTTHIIPFVTIAESIKLYANMHAPSPDFGIDVYTTDVTDENVVLLSNNGEGNKGIPIRCDHYIVVFCKNGEGLKRINHHRFPIIKNSVHIIFPGDIHSFSNTSSDFEIVILLFKKAQFIKLAIPNLVLDQLLNINSECIPNIKLTLQEFLFWHKKLEELDKELKSQEGYFNEVASGILLTLLANIKRKLEFQTEGVPNKTRQQEILGTFKKLVETNFQTLKKVNDYAALMHLSSKHLSEIIKTQSNKTALLHIHERILNEAEYLLTYSNASVSEIAFSLNYDNPSHFGRFFKSLKGITHLKYKANFG